VRTDSLAGAVANMLGALPTPEGARIEHRLDDEAMGLIPPQHAAEVVNILREAVSNSLRHGGARHVTVRAERGESSVALAVIDDGAGFDLTRRLISSGGHGLANMQVRAAAIGATLHVTSTPGKGTRVLLNVPVNALS
jgi:signal transduction histidine kinase